MSEEQYVDPIFLAAERLRQYEESLGGSGSPYHRDSQHNFADDMVLVLDFVESFRGLKDAEN
jgi:hypothetical protein